VGKIWVFKLLVCVGRPNIRGAADAELRHSQFQTCTLFSGLVLQPHRSRMKGCTQ